jgi:hypothetical protein
MTWGVFLRWLLINMVTGYDHPNSYVKYNRSGIIYPASYIQPGFYTPKQFTCWLYSVFNPNLPYIAT